MEDQPKHRSTKLKCALCNHPFNLSSREPINLICCDQIACRMCVQSTMIKSEDKNLIVKG